MHHALLKEWDDRKTRAEGEGASLEKEEPQLQEHVRVGAQHRGDNVREAEREQARRRAKTRPRRRRVQQHTDEP